MEWTEDVSAGDWIRDRLDADWSGPPTMHQVVPRGFPAYVRIFHPATRDRPIGEPWPGLPYARHRREWDAFQARNPEITVERVSWADTAAALGTTMHLLAQWQHVVAPGVIVENEDGPRDSAGWRYGYPSMGDLEPDVVAVIAQNLAAHTETSDAGYVAVWEGFGGLLGFIGEGPSRAFFQIGDPNSPELAAHNEVLEWATTDRLNKVFAQPTWQEGILSREISEGARLELPNRGHVLFRGGISELESDDWMLRVPWRDHVAEAHGFPSRPHAPSLAWPDDRAWVVVTEVDYESTVVGGSPELVAAILADPRLESAAIPEGADLSWDGDEVNR